jgi:dTDP-4-dehydrorhamnose reductase
LKVLVLGSNGLIGSNIVKVLSGDLSLEVFGTINVNIHPRLERDFSTKIFRGVNVLNSAKLLEVFELIGPEVVINCVGLTKHKHDEFRAIDAIALNALYPHRLAEIARIFGSRLIHFSTDCVFSGGRGLYSEVDPPDAVDLYGRSKALGEVLYGNALTIRTSTIGHELGSNHGLLDWFLSQQLRCKGFSQAVFSGLPTVIIARVLRDYILRDKTMIGLYHIAANPINKYDLLKLIAKEYGKKIDIEIDDELKIDRSLNSSKFNQVTGFCCPEWPILIKEMHLFR